jgi:uncharacterized membrane protein
MGFLGDFFIRLGFLPKCIIGAILGFVAGIFVVLFGFFPFLLILILTFGGFAIGKLIDEDAPIVSSLKKFFTGKKSDDDNDEM